ncbi:MAG: AMP-binding protein [Limisphaerales bacterium]
MNTILTTESVPGAFARAVSKFGPGIAISAPAGQWTYAELDQRSDGIAAKILERLGKDSALVALLLEHDAPLIAAIFGVLKANKIYVALDPGHPPEQLAAMLDNSGAKLLLAGKANLPLANSFASDQLEILPVIENASAGTPSNDCQEISGEAGAWLMFTSGSTGAPKGIWQNHCGLVHEAEVYAELAGITSADRVSLLTSCGLSASGATLFGALLHGATLCLFHVRSQGIERLADWLRRERITVFHSVPAVFRYLARVPDAKNSLTGLRLVRLGGEPVLQVDVDVFRQLCPDNCVFAQSFSSTETGVISTFMMDKRIVLAGRRVPAGRAVRGVDIFLVDDNNRPLENGGEGRIAVRSLHLRQGYWRQPGLTAEKFLADVQHPGARIFISNDLGRFLPGGDLEHLGRADQLVKIRGQRVDLGEVEAVLLATGLVQEAVVTVDEDATGEKRLMAHFVPGAGVKVAPQILRRELWKLLAEYMIPNDFIALEKLPLTAAGKIDRRALPLPRVKGGAVLSRSHRPRDLVETRVARIWQSALNLSPIARTADFFELGGTSLQSVEVLLHIEERFGISLPPSTLAEHSTIEKLAALLTDCVVIPSQKPLVTLCEHTGGRPFFLIHSGQGDVTSYALLARRLPGRPIYGLQSVGLQGENWPLMSIQAMAQRYLREVVEKDPTGPYLLGATCMGGLVAFEMARRLVGEGRQVALLAMFDTRFSQSRWVHPDPVERFYGAVRDPVRDGCRVVRWAMIRAAGFGRSRRGLLAYRRFVTHMNSRAYRRYHPKFFPGAITMFSTSDTNYTAADARFMQDHYARTAQIVRVACGRAGLFIPPGVDELADQLQKRLDAVS